MLRGVVEFPESSLTYLHANQSVFSASLKQKLSLLSLQHLGLELNEDEVEEILDNLPAPRPELQVTNQLRELCLKTLQQWRHIL